MWGVRVRVTVRVKVGVSGAWMVGMASVVWVCVKTSLKLIVRASRSGTGQGKVIFQVEG